MNTNYNTTSPHPWLTTAAWYCLPGMRDESSFEAIQRFTRALWDIADWSTRGPVILRVLNFMHLHSAAMTLIEMFIDSPEKFRQLMLMPPDDDDQRRTERALDVMRRENIVVWFADIAHQRWFELNTHTEKKPMGAEFPEPFHMKRQNMNTVREYLAKRTWALPLMVGGLAVNYQPRRWEEEVDYQILPGNIPRAPVRLFLDRVRDAAEGSRLWPTLLRLRQIERYEDIVIYWLAVLLNVKPGAAVVWLDSRRVEFNPHNLIVDLWFDNHPRGSMPIARRIFEHAPTQQQH